MGSLVSLEPEQYTNGELCIDRLSLSEYSALVEMGFFVTEEEAWTDFHGQLKLGSRSLVIIVEFTESLQLLMQLLLPAFLKPVLDCYTGQPGVVSLCRNSSEKEIGTVRYEPDQHELVNLKWPLGLGWSTEFGSQSPIEVQTGQPSLAGLR